jgi:hypothetical protein
MTDPHTSQARIARAGAPDRTVGCGLLVTPRHLVTCAHVVAESLGINAATAEPPTDPIPVDLPLLPRPFHTRARVVCWCPLREAADKAPEDIALLELAHPLPPAAAPAPLLSLQPDDYTGLVVHCFGFPAGIDEGVRRPGTCRGENALGWVQLDLERVLREHLADHPGSRLLLVVDQLEELFTNVQPIAPAKARDFAAALTALSGADLPVHLLIALRADFMGQAMEGPTAAFVAPACQLQVGPLTGDGLRAAIEGPARAPGVRFAPGLVERILAELADQPGRLPLLQFALARLWEEQRARSIDAAALARIGGVRRALADYADGSSAP